MAWQGLKLNLKVAQKQILTPGLVQMVSVLARDAADKDVRCL